MNRTHTLLLLLATASALPGVARAELQTWREQSDYQRDTRGITAIEVENARGQVIVQASHDDRFHLRALKIARANHLDTAKQLAASTEVTLDDRDGRLAVAVHYPRRVVHVNLWESFDNASGHDDEVRLYVEVPNQLPVTLVSASGDLESHGMRGRQSLRAASGDIAVGQAGGPVTVETASGDIEAEDLSGGSLSTGSGDITVAGATGTLAVGTTSGDVVVSDVGDSVHVSTTSGDIRVTRSERGAWVATTSGQVTLDGAGGRIRVRSSSGDVDARLSGGLRDADLSTQSGTLEATLDPALGVDLTMTTSSGAMDINGPIEQTHRSRREIRARVRGGGVPVDLHSASGDIRVTVGKGQ